MIYRNWAAPEKKFLQLESAVGNSPSRRWMNLSYAMASSQPGYLIWFRKRLSNLTAPYLATFDICRCFQPGQRPQQMSIRVLRNINALNRPHLPD